MSKQHSQTEPEHLQTSPDSQAHPSKQPRQRRIIAWKQGAQMLADGAAVGAVAAALGIDEDRLWQHMQRSARFGFHLEQAIDRNRLLAQLRLRSAGAKALVEAALKEPGSDTERLKWLCAACGVVDPAVAAAPDGADEMVRRLRDTGRRRQRSVSAAAGPNKRSPDTNKRPPDSNKPNPDFNKAAAGQTWHNDGIRLPVSIPAFAPDTVSRAAPPG